MALIRPRIIVTPAGMVGTGGGSGGTTSSDTDVQAWINAVNGAGGNVTQARAGIFTTMATSLKSHGLWARHDRLWILAGTEHHEADIDFKARASLTNHS